MKKELSPQEIKFDIEFEDNLQNEEEIPEIKDAYKKIRRSLNISKEGYNLYLIDSFSKYKLKKLMNYIREQYKGLKPPKDICYVILQDEKRPEVLMVDNGNGEKLKKTIEEIKNSYINVVEEFYTSSTDEEKDDLIDEIQSKRNGYIEDLMDMAKSEGFDVKSTTKGFAFIPLSAGKIMTEKEYDGLEKIRKEEIITKASELKKKAENILEKLKDIESKSIKKLKDMFSDFLVNEMEDIKDEALLKFINDDNIYEYLEKIFIEIEKDIVECYTMSIEEDEEELYQAINKYQVKVLVDNTLNTNPVVIYEDDPNLNNLMGSIEYENKNGIYTTDISLINSGSILKANEGCLIIRISSLANNPYSYYYLKKVLMTNKLNYDFSKGYSELMPINSLKPSPIEVKLKVILIGDYETYDALYNGDEDFKKLFSLRSEFNNVIDMNDKVNSYVKEFISQKIKENSIMEIDKEGIYEIFKYLSRKACNKNRISIDDFDIEKLIILANDLAKEKNSNIITAKDIIEIAYEEESIEKEFAKMYKENKILISVKDKKVGVVNALSVLDTGYSIFGKPMRVTCVAYKGSGKIIDIHKESNLSGKIHGKSINILTGLLNNIVDPYKTLPVDFHLSFEQIYGMIEGDSASVAEAICILSALSKRPIKQNIAITGSLNQFGEVQAIGGVNEKIEGFYNICKSIDSEENKGVLIPSSNKDELILIPEVENSIKEGKFHIYIMDTLEDAIETMILEDDETIEEFYQQINNELNRYENVKSDSE